MLTRPCRRGLTLAEIMVGLVVTLVVTGAVYRLLLTAQRLTRNQAERVALQSSVRAGSLIVFNELADLSTLAGGTPEQNDVVAMGASAISYRAMRGIGFVCDSPGPGVVRLARSSFSGHRDPQAGRDEAYVFVAGDSATVTKDAWVPLRILSVTSSSPCPGAGGSSITLTLSGSPAPESLEAGTPVRITELMEMKLYRADGRSWLGARSVSAGEAIQPLLGPLSDPGGFELEYLNAVGSTTLDRRDIRSIRVRLSGLMAGGGEEPGPQEELVTQVALRNPWPP